MSALTHFVHTFELCTFLRQSLARTKRILCTFGYTQRLTLLFALLDQFATCGPLPQTKQILDILTSFHAHTEYVTYFKGFRIRLTVYQNSPF